MWDLENLGSLPPGDERGYKRQGSPVRGFSYGAAVLLENSVCRPWVESGLSLIALHPRLSF